jgi:selenocysteine lyase/cysteine desulfurase
MPPTWDELRKDFPALDRYVCLNAAASSPTPKPVREAVTKFYREMETTVDTLWDAWLARREVIRVKAARLIGAEADEIAFVPNASTGMNLIADLLAGDGPALTDEIEFPTVTLPWIHRGVPLHLVPAVEGVPRLESFAAAGAPRSATILISHVQYSNGCRQDLAAFGALKEGRRLVVGASQSTGAFPIDVKAWQVDALATSGQKWLCAGYGASFVYISRALVADRPPRAIGWMSVQNPFAFDNVRYQILESNQRTEMGCPAFGEIFALGAALDYLTGIGIEAIAGRILELNMYLTQRLQREGFQVLSPAGEHRSGETLVEVPDPRKAFRFLRDRAILVTRRAQGLRISTHFYNNEADIDACVAALMEYRRDLQ